MTEEKSAYSADPPIRPFEGVGKYTAFPNDAFKYIMPDCNGGTWKLVCLITRNTIGWHKPSDKMSFSQIMKGCGFSSRETCKNAIDDALDRGYILRQPDGNSFSYSLNKGYEFRTSTEIVPSGGTEIVPKTVRKSTQNGTKTEHTKQKKENFLNVFKGLKVSDNEKLLFAELQEFLKTNVAQKSYQAFAADLAYIGAVDGTACISAGSSYQRDWVDARLSDHIQSILGMDVLVITNDQAQSIQGVIQ
ncbi:MAG: hypothetical protein KAJ07_04645 [Planctomycetes bacterium]|nr:hypothetical protein [Planctomycetota bacterium]